MPQQIPQTWLLVAAIIMVVVLFEFSPRWGGWVLLLVVLGYLFRQQLGFNPGGA